MADLEMADYNVTKFDGGGGDDNVVVVDCC